MFYYYLNPDHTYHECDVFTWAKQLEDMNTHVGWDDIDGNVVSTVWLGLDHNVGKGEPHVFETMIFKNIGDDEIYLKRYATWAEAEHGHQLAIQWLKDNDKI